MCRIILYDITIIIYYNNIVILKLDLGLIVNLALNNIKLYLLWIA